MMVGFEVLRYDARGTRIERQYYSRWGTRYRDQQPLVEASLLAVPTRASNGSAGTARRADRRVLMSGSLR